MDFKCLHDIGGQVWWFCAVSKNLNLARWVETVLAVTQATSEIPLKIAPVPNVVETRWRVGFLSASWRWLMWLWPHTPGWRLTMPGWRRPPSSSPLDSRCYRKERKKQQRWVSVLFHFDFCSHLYVILLSSVFVDVLRVMLMQLLFVCVCAWAMR